MAVDTRNKRAAAVTIGRAAGGVWPNPDGSLASQADRQHMAYAYPGINADAPQETGIVGHGGMLLLGVG